MKTLKFIQHKSGIWIPEDTKLDSHPAKTRNYAELPEFGKFKRINLVGIPVLQADSLEGRVEEAKKLIQQSLSQKEIGLNKKDFMIRSALTFEDTEEYRAAGIGHSVRLQDIKCLDGKLRYDILDLDANKDIQEYVGKHNISNFGIGLQLCNTVTGVELDIDGVELRRPAYSGSVKLIALDLAEIVVNFGFSFNEHHKNISGDFRLLYELKEDVWEKLFERTDDRHCSVYPSQSFVEELLKYLTFLKQRKEFSQGIDFEYVQPELSSDISVVQYAPIKFMQEPKLSNALFQYCNNPDKEYSQIVGCGEGYFSADKIFFVDLCTGMEELKEFNLKHPEGYLIINKGGQTIELTEKTNLYEATSNAIAIVDLEKHDNPLSDHNTNLCREEGKMMAVPNHWFNAANLSVNLLFENPKISDAIKSQGASIQINERTQECKFSTGNVWKK